MTEDKMEERILAYLLGECDEEEAFEVEKMCRDNALWQSEKIRYGQILGLLEESINQPEPESLSEKETKLNEDQRNEIKSLLAINSRTDSKNEDDNSGENKNDRKENDMTDKEENKAEKFKSTLLGTTDCCCRGSHYRLLWEVLKKKQRMQQMIFIQPLKKASPKMKSSLTVFKKAL